MVRPSITPSARAAAAFAAVALGLAAAPLDRADEAAGAWEMSLDGSHRKCRVTLGAERPGAPPGPCAFQLAAGARCRSLTPRRGWGFEKGLIRFIGKDGQSDRYLEREVCRVSLGFAMLDASGRYEARLLDGCHDSGLQVFDPVAWRYEAGRLTLQARRGHQVSLISERDGQWRRDPDVGTTLVLRKTEP